MQHVLARFEEGLEILGVLLLVDLRGARHNAFRHARVELLERHGLAEVVGVFLIAQEVMKAYVSYVPVLVMLLVQIAGRAAAQNEIAHEMILSF